MEMILALPQFQNEETNTGRIIEQDIYDQVGLTL